jgi:hypothetical protein
MKKLKIIAGITWAFICLIIIIVLFPGLNSFSASAARLPFMKINPNYTGGEIAYQIIETSCTLDVRRPVFDGLLSEKNKGFVQIDWKGNVPENISDTIDYNRDNNPDFKIAIDRINTKTTLDALNKKVIGVAVSTPTSYGWAVRVEVMK